MGKASISIAITSNYNSRGLDKARADFERLAVQAVSLHGKIGKSAVDAGALLGQTGARLESLGKQIASVGDKLTRGVTIPVGIAAAATTMAATEIDTAWYNVRKTVDMTEQGYEDLKKSAIELSDIQPVSAATLLDIESLGGQLGISTGYLKEFARVVSGLDIATNLDADTAATDLAQFRNIVQMSEDDLDNWASTVVDLGNHTATTEADLVNLAMRFASAGHIAGMSNADILGMSAALAGLGMRAEAGGSAISRTINEINTSVSIGGERVQKWADLVGMSIDQFTEAWRSAPTDTFMQVLQNISNAGEDMGAVLEDLGITQIRQSDAMRRLASSGEYVNDVIERANGAWSQNSALTQEVENRNESLAAKFETIGNRITNTAAIIGEPIADGILHALDAMEPLINAIRDGAEAFANLNPETQDFILKLVGIAAAAGPTLSIFGRLVQGAGSFFKTVGRAAQQTGIFVEALNTTDAAMFRTLNDNKSFAAQLGLSHNKLVKAAGGTTLFKNKLNDASEVTRIMAERTERARIYEEAYNDALGRGVTSTTELNNAARAATTTRKAQQKITQAGAKAVNEMAAAEALNVHYSEEHKEKLLEEGAALDITKNKANAFKLALLGIGVTAGIALLTAAFTYFATEAEHARERAENLQKATKGLEGACDSAAIHMDSQARSEEALATSHGNLSSATDELLEKQAQLADDIAETNRTANDQIGDLNRAWKVIEEYSNQSGLSADKQFLLKEAIETVNELGGTQYEVVDAVNGKIADENGTLQENTDKLKANIEAIKQQVRMKAIQSNIESLESQKAENTRTIAEYYAQNGDTISADKKTLAEMDKLYSEMQKARESGDKDRLAELGKQYMELELSVHDCTKEVVALEEANKSNEAAIKSQTRALELQGQEVRSLSEDLELAFESNGRDEYFNQFEKDVQQFSASCEDMGLSVEDFEKMSEETFANLVKNYKGTSVSIIDELQKTTEGMTILFESAPNIGDAWSNAEHTIDEFAEKCVQFGINFHSMNALGSENMKKLSENFDGSVQSIIESLATMGPQGQQYIDNLVRDWTAGFSTGTQGMLASVATLRGSTVGELMAICQDFGLVSEEAVRAFLEGLQNADLGTTPEEVAIAVAEKMKQHDANFESGVANGTSYKEGVESTTGQNEEAGRAVGSSSANGAKSTSDEHYTSGAINGGAYANGVWDYEPAAHTAGYGIGASAANAESSTERQHHDAGLKDGNSFAGGILGATDKANGNAKTLSSGAAAKLDTGDAGWQWGYHLGVNFADGLNAGGAFASRKAEEVAFSVAHLLRHSTPEAGPLKDDDVWGYHFAQNLAEGMRKGTPLIARQASAIASSMALDSQQIASSTSRAVISRYGASQAQWQGYQTRGQTATQAQAQAKGATTPYLTRDDVREAVAEAISEAVPPEFAMYLNGSKLASSIAGDMDYELGQLDARR